MSARFRGAATPTAPPAPPDAPPRNRGRRGSGGDKQSGRSAPQTSPIPRRTAPKSTTEAKARAKARKAKAPKVVREPWRDRLIARLSEIDLNPRTLAAKVPFVALVIGSLGVGLGLTLWLSTDSAERSYELGNARDTNKALTQQKEALERDVQQAQAAPALAEAARNLGMIPSRDTAHLVQDAAGNWIVVGTPMPAAGVSPPPLNTPLPEEKPTTSVAPRPVDPREVVVHLPSPTEATAAVPGAMPATAASAPTGTGPEVLVRTPTPGATALPTATAPAPAPLDQHAATPGVVAPGPVPSDTAPLAVPAAADAPQPVTAPAAPVSVAPAPAAPAAVPASVEQPQNSTPTA
jgi:hypothetical protein